MNQNTMNQNTMNQNTMNQNTMNQNKPTSGGGAKDKIVGAVQVAHGVGERLRGTALAAVDKATGYLSSAQEHEQTILRGKSEMDQGMAKLRGPTVSGAGGGPTAGTEQAYPGADAAPHAQEGYTPTMPQPTAGYGPAQHQTVPETKQYYGEQGLGPAAAGQGAGYNQAGSTTKYGPEQYPTAPKQYYGEQGSGSAVDGQDAGYNQVSSLPPGATPVNVQ